MINTTTGIIGGVYTEQCWTTSLPKKPITTPSLHVGTALYKKCQRSLSLNSCHKVLMASPLHTLRTKNRHQYNYYNYSITKQTVLAVVNFLTSVLSGTICHSGTLTCSWRKYPKVWKTKLPTRHVISVRKDVDIRHGLLYLQPALATHTHIRFHGSMTEHDWPIPRLGNYLISKVHA